MISQSLKDIVLVEKGLAEPGNCVSIVVKQPASNRNTALDAVYYDFPDNGEFIQKFRIPLDAEWVRIESNGCVCHSMKNVEADIWHTFPLPVGLHDTYVGQRFLVVQYKKYRPTIDLSVIHCEGSTRDLVVAQSRLAVTEAK